MNRHAWVQCCHDRGLRVVEKIVLTIKARYISSIVAASVSLWWTFSTGLVCRSCRCCIIGIILAYISGPPFAS